MKYWIPVSIAVVIAAFVVAGCGETKPPEEGWTYVGTWVNSAYNGHNGGPAGKMVMTATSGTDYNNDTDTTPVFSGSFTLADDWTSGGDHYFKGISVAGGNTLFLLLRVSNTNNTLELNGSSTAYPTSIDPAGAIYAIYTRQ
ncbi:MAG: hypothetical protein ABSG38_11250 [Spirochaetia bacterium]|jgi:hypothetical protein